MLLRLSSLPRRGGATIRRWSTDPDVATGAELIVVWLMVAISVYLAGWLAQHTYGTASWAVSEGFPPRGIFGRWDVLNYIRLAQEGYAAAPENHPAWFPGLPLLMAVGARAGIAPLVTGTALALVSGAMLVLAFYRLALIDLPRSAARYSALALLLFPSSFFLFIAYVEAPFLLAVVGSFWAARRRQWAVAALLAAVASGLRVTGVLLAPALLLEYLQAAGWRRQAVRADVLWLLLAPLGLVAYMAYLAYEFGDPFRFYHAQAHWGRALDTGGAGHLLDQVDVLASSGAFETRMPLLLGLAGAAFFIAALPLMVRFGTRASYLAFAVMAVAAPLATGRLESMNRYILVAFPIFFVMGRLADRYVVLRPVAIVFVSLLALSAARFATYYWVG